MLARFVSACSTRSFLGRLALTGLPLASAGLARVDAAGELVVATGEHYSLHYDGGDEGIAQAGLDAIERVWPIVVDFLGVPDHSLERPLEVHLHRTIAAYEAADMELSGGKFQRNLAMSLHASKSAHVALQPPCSDEVLRAISLPGQTLALLAWEACHVARYELCPNFAHHPMWFVDGLAAYVSSEVLEDLRPCGDATETPFFASALAEVQGLQEGGKLPPAGAILADRIDELSFSKRYAVRQVLFRFLAEGAKASKLRQVVGVIRSTGGGGDYAQTVLAAATKAFGSSLDKDFAKYVSRLAPAWREMYRSLTTSGTEWHQLAFEDQNAVAWNGESVRGGLAASGSLRILPGPGKQLNFLFGRSELGFYSVAFVADDGFTVFEYRALDNTWNRIGGADTPGLRLGYTSTFEVRAKGVDLTVLLDGRSWPFELPRPLPDEVEWGLGAQAGSAGLWIDVEVRAAKR